MTAWKVQQLHSKHKRDSFSCGEEVLDEYIKKYASQDIKRKLSQVFITTDNDNNIIGYYTISASSFQKTSLREDYAKKLPFYPIPAAIIGRLAVDKSVQKKGLGEFLLMDALDRISSASEVMAVYAVIVDAKNKKAEEFYKRYGFMSFIDKESRLFMPLKDIKASL